MGGFVQVAKATVNSQAHLENLKPFAASTLEQPEGFVRGI